MKKKGFTLVELLVVIAIIAMLMGILMPALARVRFIAQRVVCGTHLSGIGKSMLTYANDYDHKYARAGGMDSYWGPLQGAWNAELEVDAFGVPPGLPATIGSSLFLLVRYADAGTKIFICSGDTGSRQFKLIDYPGSNVLRQDVTEAWDFAGPSDLFGNPPAMHYSYSYHVPFGQIGTAYYPLAGLSDAGMAMMADRSPYLAIDPEPTPPGCPPFMYNGTREQESYGNSASHRREGQNVLFNDCHVDWEEKSYCGIDDDNIYTIQNTPPWKEVGTAPTSDPTTCFDPDFLPRNRVDSVLINEGQPQGYATKI